MGGFVFAALLLFALVATGERAAGAAAAFAVPCWPHATCKPSHMARGMPGSRSLPVRDLLLPAAAAAFVTLAALPLVNALGDAPQRERRTIVSRDTHRPGSGKRGSSHIGSSVRVLLSNRTAHRDLIVRTGARESPSARSAAGLAIDLGDTRRPIGGRCSPPARAPAHGSFRWRNR